MKGVTLKMAIIFIYDDNNNFVKFDCIFRSQIYEYLTLNKPKKHLISYFQKRFMTKTDISPIEFFSALDTIKKEELIETAVLICGGGDCKREHIQYTYRKKPLKLTNKMLGW